MRRFGFWQASSVVAITAASVVGCGPAFGTTGDPGAGGSTGTGQGGQGAGSGTLSGGGSTSSGQTGCTPGDLGTCPEGEYCHAETQTCTSCADTTRFAFDEPRSMKVKLPPAPSMLSAYAPRISPTGRLYFQVGVAPTKGDLAFAEKDADDSPSRPMKWGEGKLVEGSFNTPLDEGGPLVLVNGDAVKFVLDDALDPKSPILLFHQESGTGRKLVAANESGSDAYPLQLLMTGKNDMELAAAKPGAVGRLWYMSSVLTNGADDELVTSSDGDKPKKVTVVLEEGCPAKGHLFPWVTLDGKLMVHHTRDIDPNTCTPPLDVKFHLYYTPLEPGTGQQANGSKSRRIFPNDEGNHVTPSLSPDMCVLYFSKIQVSGSAELFMAARH